MRTVVRCLALVAALAALVPVAPAAAGSVAQVYYVPLPEDQIHAALTGIFPGPAACGAGQSPGVGDSILTYLSITPAVHGTVLTYDHWEDGYEADITRPAQASTEVWGDGNPANGSAPGFADDRIGAGGVIVLHNEVSIANRGAVLDYDGGDKLAASLPIAMTRAAWASGTGTQLAGALEMRELRDWGRAFRAPVGENVAGTEMFQLTSLLVMASRDATRVAIDANADGSAEVSVTLDEGQSYQVQRGVLAGASVSASEPVQVALITGDVCATYQSRWFSLDPKNHWGGSAYAPVGTPADHPTAVYVFNPGAAPVTVVRETLGGRDAGVALAAGAVRAFTVPEGSGARFSSALGEPILAVGAVDAGGSAHEWSFSLIHESLLTPQALVGWGAGRDPLSDVKPEENGSPVWVTPVLPGGGRGSVRVCVDFNGDNLGDLAGTGFRYDLRLDLTTFESFRLYDPDGDQTGMILSVCDGSGALLAVAWGQDPSAASTPHPGIDLGTTVPPLPAMAAVKDVELAVDSDGDGLPGPGDTLRYFVRVRNVSRRPVTNLVVSDELPAHTSYVGGSTTVDAGAGPIALPDAGLTPFPLDEGGASLGTLSAGDSLAVSFLVRIDDLLPADVRTVLNRAFVHCDTEELEVEAVLPLAPWEARPALALVKSAVIETVGSPGTGTVGYWKNHPEAWPVVEMTVGGRTYSREQALVLLETSGRGDKTYDLYRQLVPARLNVLAGNNGSCIAATLAAADAWLALHPPGSAVHSSSAAWRNAGAGLQSTLDAYNNGLLCASHRDDTAAGAVRHDVVFTIVATNTGNVNLDDVSVMDPALQSCDAFLGPLPAFGGRASTWSTTCRVEGVQGDLVNAATVSGTAPGGVLVKAQAEVFVDLPGTAQADRTAGGARSLAHWREAPEAWPVSALVLGGATRTRAGIQSVLKGCRRGDPACALFGQLAAARLNFFGGADPACVARTVREADAWLASHPPGSRPGARGASWVRAGNRLAATLTRYNRGLLCAPPAAD